jgi:hypothetical protein
MQNATLLGDSKAYRQLILPLTSIKLRSLKAAQYMNLRAKLVGYIMFLVMWPDRCFSIVGMIIRRMKIIYSDTIKLILDEVSSVLVEDNRKTVDFAVENKILIRPTC